MNFSSRMSTNISCSVRAAKTGCTLFQTCDYKGLKSSKWKTQEEVYKYQQRISKVGQIRTRCGKHFVNILYQPSKTSDF